MSKSITTTRQQREALIELSKRFGTTGSITQPMGTFIYSTINGVTYELPTYGGILNV